jgi:hypothetical protein
MRAPVPPELWCVDCLFAFWNSASWIEVLYTQAVSVEPDMPPAPRFLIKWRGVEGIRELVMALEAGPVLEVRINNLTVGLVAATMVEGTARCVQHPAMPPLPLRPRAR